MKTPREIVESLELCASPEKVNQWCSKCAYDPGNNCVHKMHTDAAKLIQDMEIAFELYGGDAGITAAYEERARLEEENRALRTELTENHIGDVNKKVETKPWGQYWENICNLNARQEAKGRKKYGEPLEDNTTLTTTQRIEHAQEEAIDLLKYLEHLKRVAEDGITANDYQRACLRTATSDKSEWLENAIYGIIGEAGEIVDLVKKHKWQGHELDAHEVALELGDLLWYGSLLASAIDYELGTVMQMNEEKLKKRYPEGFRKERSINREENKGAG